MVFAAVTAGLHDKDGSAACVRRTIQYKHGIVSLRDVGEVIVDCCVTGRGHCSLFGAVVARVVLGGVGERQRLARSLDLKIQFDVQALDEKTDEE